LQLAIPENDMADGFRFDIQHGVTIAIWCSTYIDMGQARLAFLHKFLRARWTPVPDCPYHDRDSASTAHRKPGEQA
jgi:hypothetical protein